MPYRRLVRDRRTEVWLGVAAYVLGSWLLWDAYEGRGRSKPWAARWLPGA
jgi:hypothetical protein